MNEKYRADLPAWIFIGGLTNFPWLMVWANSVHGFRFTDWLVAISVSGFGFAWLIGFRIVITPTELIFRSLFHGKKSIKHDDIKKVRLGCNFPKTNKSTLSLIVEPRSEMKNLEINAKVFSKTAIGAVLDLGKRVAEVDDGGLREGIVRKFLDARKQRGK